MKPKQEVLTDDELVDFQLLHGVGGCGFLFGLQSTWLGFIANLRDYSPWRTQRDLVAVIRDSGSVWYGCVRVWWLKLNV